MKSSLIYIKPLIQLEFDTGIEVLSGRLLWGLQQSEGCIIHLMANPRLFWPIERGNEGFRNFKNSKFQALKTSN